MKNERLSFKRCVIPSAFFLLASFLAFFSFSASLFSASISNEGKTIVKVNARSAQGIVGGGSLKPGQNLNLKSDVLWIEHVPEGGSTEVRLKIIENDGRVGSINSPGGRYTFKPASGSGSGVKTEKKTSPQVLVSGYADNLGSSAMLLSLIDKGNAQSYLLVLPGQKVTIPQDTVEVIVDRHGWSSGDVQIILFLVMPDGKEHTIRTAHAVVRTGSEDSR